MAAQRNVSHQPATMERRLSASDTKGPWVVRAIWPLNHAWVSMERLGSTLVTQVHENHRYVYSIYADSFTIKSCKGWRTQTARVHFEMNWLQYIELPESCHSKRSSRSIVILPSYQDSRIWSGVAWSARVKLLSLSLSYAWSCVNFLFLHFVYACVSFASLRIW